MFKRHRFETNMSREIESHLEQATQDYIARGLSPEEARLRARREFGGIDLAKEELRDTRRLRWFADFLQDARFTLRTWRRNPGFAAGVVAVLALGTGSATALFSVLDRILFRPLPYADPDRLVSFGQVLPIVGVTSSREIMLGTRVFPILAARAGTLPIRHQHPGPRRALRPDRRAAGAFELRPGGVELLRRAGRAGRVGTQFHRGRGPEGSADGRRNQPCAVATAVRRRSAGHGQAAARSMASPCGWWAYCSPASNRRLATRTCSCRNNCAPSTQARMPAGSSRPSDA